MWLAVFYSDKFGSLENVTKPAITIWVGCETCSNISEGTLQGRVSFQPVLSAQVEYGRGLILIVIDHNIWDGWFRGHYGMFCS